MGLREKLSENPVFVIYGAQVVACGAYHAIKALHGRAPESFIVSGLKGNPEEIDGVPVRTPEAIPEGALVIVAVTELLQKEVLGGLESMGISNTFTLTQREEHLLMSEYFKSLGLFPVLSGKTRGQPADLAVFEVRNHRDKPLEAPPRLFPYEIPIQAGAALTPNRIAPLADDAGDNISAKNRQYCEMTAVYWVWKHDSHKWKGIEHYRRHLLVKPEQLRGDLDAVLPLPYICYPNTAAQFRRFVSDGVLNALVKALKELHPERLEEYMAVLYGRYQYTYNLVCARDDVFSAYCEWFFEITGYMEGMAGEVPELASTRALSYAAEVLTNIYFMTSGLNIRHAQKEIYV